MQADGVADGMTTNILTDLLDLARHFVPERERKWLHTRTTGPVVHVGVTDAGRSNAHEHVAGTAARHRDVGIFNGATRSGETDSAHKQA